MPVGYDCKVSSCTLPGKLTHLNTSLKCLYINACSMGNKEEELEINVQLLGFNLIAVTWTWWDRMHDWHVVMNGYKLFRKDRPRR